MCLSKWEGGMNSHEFYDIIIKEIKKQLITKKQEEI